MAACVWYCVRLHAPTLNQVHAANTHMISHATAACVLREEGTSRCGNTHLSASTLRFSISEPGLARIQTSTPWGSGGMAWPGLLGAVGDFLLFSSCCFQKGVSVTMFGRESRPTVCFERRIAQYKCLGDAYFYLSMSLYCLLSELKAKPTKPVCACGFASAAT